MKNIGIGSLMTPTQIRAMNQNNTVSISSASAPGTLGSSINSPLSVTSGNLGSMLNNIKFSFDVNNDMHYKKYEVVESTEDLLVLSSTWYRLRQERNTNKIIGANPSELLDRILFENINDEDRNLANKIRDFYSKKIMMLKLKSVNLTPFRDDLNNFIHSDGLKFQEKICGLVYRLPEFFQYDTEFDEMVRDYKKQVPLKPSVDTHTLTHLKTLRVSKKASKRIEYWFKTENNDIANISLEPNNPLLKVWDKLVTSDLEVHATYGVKHKDGVAYYALKDFSLV